MPASMMRNCIKLQTNSIIVLGGQLTYFTPYLFAPLKTQLYTTAPRPR